MIPFVDLKRALLPIRADINQAIQRVVDSGVFLNGPEVKAFEREWAAYCGMKYCVACGTGTDAIAALTHSLPRTEPLSIRATTLEFTRTGISRGGLGVNLVDVTARGKPMGIESMAVLLYGMYPEDIVGVADACQAHGWKPTGDACFSFFPTKNLGCFGDGGAIVTESEVTEEMCRRYLVECPSRMDEIQAAVLRVKLPHLDEWNVKRCNLAEVYYAELPDWAMTVCPQDRWKQSNHHIFAVLVPERDRIEKHMLWNGVQVKVHYPKPLNDLPGATSFCGRVLSLPMYPGLTPEEVRTVCDVLRTA